MNGDKPNRLLRKIVCGLGAGRRDETKVALEVINESAVEILRFACERTLHQGIMENAVSDSHESVLKALLRRVFVAPMK